MSESTIPAPDLMQSLLDTYPQRLTTAFKVRWGFGIQYHYETDVLGIEHFYIKPVVANNRLTDQHYLWIDGYRTGEQAVRTALYDALDYPKD